MFGAAAFLAGLILVILAYLQIVELWAWIFGALGLLIGAGGVLAACYGYCMTKSILGR